MIYRTHVLTRFSIVPFISGFHLSYYHIFQYSVCLEQVGSKSMNIWELRKTVYMDGVPVCVFIGNSLLM